MGIRSTFITEHFAIELPEWFKDKWGEWLHFHKSGTLPFASKFELKEYSETFRDLKKDFSKVVKEHGTIDVPMIAMNEDEHVTRYIFKKDGTIKEIRMYDEPLGGDND